MSQQPPQREAMLYERLAGQAVRCNLCGHRCVIRPGGYGRCRVRQNSEGTLISRNYGYLVAANVDPIEKKPLYHVLPGSTSMSIAAAGCNFQCAFCQNWQISQLPREGSPDVGQCATPAQVVQAARQNRCASISYTYTEPTIYFEMAFDTAQLAVEAGLKNCFVSNGFLTPEAVRTIAPVLDAINVDLKAFRDQTYRDVMKARLAPVLECLETLVGEGVWVEVTTLVVPGMNDSDEELRDIAGFIAGKLGPDVPWHVSRYHDDYEMNGRGSTPIATIERAERIGREAGLHYVYRGNVAAGADTSCPGCGAVVVSRAPFGLKTNRLAGGACPQCGRAIPGIWA
ncbi:MAG: AmmeMemoRadiSam system radical SAM enzyme [Planctomycetes bacterium]|nr:AmmeMemoRadiSam system radical SAM enzyme [Planctomycetota bacterium]